LPVTFSVDNDFACGTRNPNSAVRPTGQLRLGARSDPELCRRSVIFFARDVALIVRVAPRHAHCASQDYSGSQKAVALKCPAGDFDQCAGDVQVVQAASALLTYYFPHSDPCRFGPEGPRTITLGRGAEAWQRRKGIGILTRYLTLGIDGAGPARSGECRCADVERRHDRADSIAAVITLCECERGGRLRI